MPRRIFLQGVRAAVPIVLGYIPVGIAFGVLARQSGLSSIEATAMSLLVFAGASQFIAVGMLGAGAGTLAIIATTLVVNLRHFLMSSTVARHAKPSSLPVTAAMGFELTDESFAVIMSAPEKIAGNHGFMLGLQSTAQAAWVGGTAVGALFGPLVNGASYGIPFALPALFICLLVLQIKSGQHIVVALAAGSLSIAFKYLLGGNWNLIIAAAIASALGMLLLREIREEKTTPERAGPG
jgi:4-azaleucine resistance transporter AzlC